MRLLRYCKNCFQPPIKLGRDPPDAVSWVGPMRKRVHEFRDPVHQFIRVDSDERRVIDSPPFQRLRHIHQLAMTYLVYPGATHRRFEHSLGVMELADNIYETVTQPHNLHDSARGLVPERSSAEHGYWRRALRIAALCHDMGHLPFSHAAEADLLPEGWDHERLTMEVIRSTSMQCIWSSMTPSVRMEDIVKLAVGPKKLRGIEFTEWEEILAEIIVGDAFGADRMDYLLRDSYHLGVAYGSYDRHRLVDTLRILPRRDRQSEEMSLGVEAGGLESAVALLLARYFMYKQVYFHPVRRIYDIHLKDFLKKWLDDGVFAIDIERHLKTTDNEVLAEISKAASRPGDTSHDAAVRIATRSHFKLLYERSTSRDERDLESGPALYKAAVQEFGAERIREDRYPSKGGLPDFPVLQNDGRIDSSLNVSEAIRAIPAPIVDCIFVDRDILPQAQRWRDTNYDAIISQGLGS